MGSSVDSQMLPLSRQSSLSQVTWPLEQDFAAVGANLKLFRRRSGSALATKCGSPITTRTAGFRQLLYKPLANKRNGPECQLPFRSIAAEENPLELFNRKPKIAI
jgi:hypothetical protein